MKKIFVVLLVLVMALMLLPALAAGAEEYDDYKIDSVLWPEDVPYSGQLVPANVYGHNPKYDGWEFVECIKLKAQIVGTTAATCTSTGSALCYAEAEYAGKKFQLSHKYTISALGHKGNATCTKTGICETCGQEYGPLDHDFSVDEPKKEANCTEAGYTAHKKCSICGSKDESYEVIPALGHDWGPWEVQSDGTHKRTCQRDDCGETETHAAAWGDWTKVDETSHKQTCQVDGCGISETVDHVWNGNHWCGYPRVCEYCEEYYGETLDHEFLYEYIDEDQHKAECRHCDLVVPEAHSGGKATCTEKAKCEKCEEAYGDPLDHSWSTDWSWDEDTHWHPCNNEGCNVRRDEKAHTETSEPGKTATCTEPGYTGSTRCSVCGAPMTEQTAIDPLGHQLTPVAKVEPTCTAPGTEAYWKCTRDGCGKLFSDAEGNHEITAPAAIEALGHDLVRHEAKAATCTAVGWAAYDTCSRCDYTTYEEIEALGHGFSDWTQTTEPTCTEAGEETRYCSRCSETETRPVDALGHDWGVWEVSTVPTETEAGVEGHYCKHCGKTETRSIDPIKPEPEPEPEPESEPARPDTEPKEVTYSITVAEQEGAVVTVSKTRAYSSDTITIRCTLAEGFKLSKIIVKPRIGEQIKVKSKLDGSYKFSMPRCDVTVKVVLVGSQTTGFVDDQTIWTAPATVQLPFGDMTEDMDGYEDVKYVYEKGIMTGLSETEFGPDVSLSRAMLVKLLWHLEGRPAAEYAGAFDDVPAGEWYSAAVEWVASKGIVLGYGDGTFGLNDDVTREFLATVLYRYAKWKGYKADASDAVVDGSSDWAAEAMNWAASIGLLVPDADGDYRSGEPATRAEIAKALHVFLEDVAE